MFHWQSTHRIFGYPSTSSLRCSLNQKSAAERSCDMERDGSFSLLFLLEWHRKSEKLNSPLKSDCFWKRFDVSLRKVNIYNYPLLTIINDLLKTKFKVIQSLQWKVLTISSYIFCLREGISVKEDIKQRSLS